MGRPKGSKNIIQTGITYPRKCKKCNYISNNPSMYHYHNKTHDAVDGKICDHGCGLPAVSKSTRGRYCCSDVYTSCPGYIKNSVARTTEHWARPESDQRKENAKKTFIASVHNRETVDKARKTKWAKWGMENATEAQWKDFKRYARSCRKLSQLWAKDNGYELGQQTFHVDHIFSIMDGFRNKISPSIMSHPANLRVIEAKKNSAKGGKSEITLAELLKLTED